MSLFCILSTWPHEKKLGLGCRLCLSYSRRDIRTSSWTDWRQYQHHRSNLETCEGFPERLQPQDKLHLLFFWIHVHISLPRTCHWPLHNISSRHHTCRLVAPACARIPTLSTATKNYVTLLRLYPPPTHSLLDTLWLPSYWKCFCSCGAKLH